MFVIFYLLFTHKVKNNKILVVAAILEIIVSQFLYCLPYQISCIMEPYWYIHSEARYSYKVARSWRRNSLDLELYWEKWESVE